MTSIQRPYIIDFTDSVAYPAANGHPGRCPAQQNLSAANEIRYRFLHCCAEDKRYS